MGTNNDAYLKAIIVDGNMETLVKQAEILGKELATQHRLSTSQIRNIFGTIRRIEMDWLSPAQIDQTTKSEQSDTSSSSAADRQQRARREFMLLIPRLAYQAAKERGRGVGALQQELEPAMRLVINTNDAEIAHKQFRNFVDFFEAILAYHRAFGGSN